ncbi:MAG: sigma-70 family RNA polymerase sigma factor [Myxococcales bacterium]|nr:sigma-70 family RNA polymerase sigma factor [Myxococcales bacterium]
MADTDRDLVERARSGDAAAFAELVRRYGPRVRRLARKLVRGHADADDVAQETFVRAHQALPRFDGRSEFFTWIYRIAVNLSLNRARSLNVRRPVALDDPSIEGVLTTRQAEAGEQLEQRRLAAALLEELEGLPAGLRATMVMVCMDGVPQEEAATILGCSVGTVAWRVHEARKRLREGLRARGMEDALDRLGGPRAGGSKKGASS